MRRRPFLIIGQSCWAWELMALPVYAAFRREFPWAQIVWRGNAQVKKIIERLKIFDETEASIVRGDENAFFSKAVKEEIKCIKNSGYELALFLQPSFLTSWILKKAGIKERVGITGRLSSLLTTRSLEYDELMGREENILKAKDFFSAPAGQLPLFPRLNMSMFDANSYFVLAFQSQHASHTMPSAKAAEIVSHFQKKWRLKCILMGEASADEWAAQVSNLSGAINLTGQATMTEEILCILSEALFVFGTVNDLCSLSAYLRTPTYTAVECENSLNFLTNLQMPGALMASPDIRGEKRADPKNAEAVSLKNLPNFTVIKMIENHPAFNRMLRFDLKTISI